MKRHPVLFADLDVASQRLVGQVFWVLAAVEHERGERLVDVLLSGDLRLTGEVWAEYQRCVKRTGREHLGLPSVH
jgi:hypothetical protein